MHETLVVETTGPEDKNYNDDLTDSLAELGVEFSVISYQEAPDSLERIKASSRIIIAGVPYFYPSEAAEDLKPYLETWLPSVEIPVLGICLGHQAVGLVFGAEMERHVEIETGLCTAEILDEHLDNLIFKGLARQFKVASYHWASIKIKETPDEMERQDRLIRLARSLEEPGVSTGCENLVVQVAGKQIYGAQFHPEKSDQGKHFLRNFIDLSGS